MAGEMNLRALLKSLSASLHEDLFVFASMAAGQPPADLRPRMIFREAEGITLILTKSEAEMAGIAYEFPCRMITLNVHSSLEAVGFIARVAAELAAHGMGVNPVSGFYHDHLFIPDGRQDEALLILGQIAKEAAEDE